MIRCHCCLDVGRVLDMHGQPRPCSRCNAEEFEKWSDSRKPPKNARPPEEERTAAK